MKAITYSSYGGPEVLKLAEAEKPTPKANEVLIKVHAASLNAADWHLMRGEPKFARLMIGLFKPKYKILGADFSGVIESVGSEVKEFKTGDEVFGDISESGFGSFAEYLVAKETSIALKPKNLALEEAAAVPLAAVTALQGLKKGGIRNGLKVLINGASGGVGTFSIQIAKAFGAEVTAVCSTKNIETAKSLGADFVIDYKKEDFTNSGKKYDLVLGINGNNSLAEYRKLLSKDGVYVMSGGSNKQLFQAMFMAPFMSRGKRMTSLIAKPNKNDLEFIKDLIEKEKIRPMVDKTFHLEQVAEGIKYLEEVHPSGKIVIIVA